MLRPAVLGSLCAPAVCLLFLPAPGVPAGSTKPRVTNVAARSRFAYRTNNDFRGRKYFPQPMCGGIAAFDFDGDGYVDLFFANGARLPELK